MQPRERASHTIRATFAALLLVLIMILGGLSLFALNGSGGTTRLATQTTAAQLAANNSAAVRSLQVNNSTSGTLQTATTATTTGQQPSATQQQTGTLDAQSIVKAVGPAVVTVVNTMQVTGRGRFGPTSQTGEAFGSGVIISSEGYIVTNQHVVADQQRLQVIFSDGTKVAATVVGEDAYSDIAVIKVDGKVPAVAEFGDSDALEAGQPVIAIGSALGDYANTVTEGIISGLHRSINDPSTGASASTSLQDLIQTDAAINHGNSGGPLLDIATGKVIGINTAVVRVTGTGYNTDTAEGLGFAVPSNTAKSIADQLIKGTPVSHP